MPAPDLSTRQIALLFKDLVHYVFGASGTVFTNNFLSISIFYPALRQQGFPKFMRAGDLSKLEISKTFYTHYTRVASLDFGEIQTQKPIFFEVRSSLFLQVHPVSDNCLFQCAVKQPIKLMPWTTFFAPTLYKKNSVFCRLNKSIHDFIPPLFVSVFSRFGAHSRSRLVASLTSPQIYKHILALKEFSQTTCICLFRKKAFHFELLFYCLLFAKLLLWILTCLTWAQPSHTHKNWTNREICTAYQKWSRISLWLWQISERAFVH